MVYVSHDAAEMRRLATQIVMLKRGRVTALGGVKVLTYSGDHGRCRPVTLPRHCERSEAIHGATCGDVDCFAALARGWAKRSVPTIGGV